MSEPEALPFVTPTHNSLTSALELKISNQAPYLFSGATHEGVEIEDDGSVSNVLHVKWFIQDTTHYQIVVRIPDSSYEVNPATLMRQTNRVRKEMQLNAESARPVNVVLRFAPKGVRTPKPWKPL
ncbi:hypothetical protein BJ508DRAFT_381197 [Ascobolus immersus RN42]|uniref:Uncharacterized protein n=1 Tax=Ascobolus immersus RN42 TaxID=1160509 RepID=A0A3N4HIH0_ASCIM|nr:hypothetical protein BJ508DRAFT_381197 [Ascobolus immersus RN42]